MVEEIQDVDPFADEPLPELAPVRAGEDLDWETVAAYLREELSGEPAAGPQRGLT